MGGLRKKMPVDLRDADLRVARHRRRSPFTSGFFSKDAILVAAYEHAPWMYWVGVITAGMTAFYVFRAFFLTFFGDYRGHEHPHESPPSMLDPAGRPRGAFAGRRIHSTSRSSWSRMFPLAEGAENCIADV